ncbi:MAG TPA: autotransporter-associated beta strand repeat-containing protein, partial [Lacipirellula sp.]
GSSSFSSTAPNDAGYVSMWTDDGGLTHEFPDQTPGGVYTTNDFRMRTPDDGGSYAFDGQLVMNNTNGRNGGLMYKGTGNTGVITMNDLVLAGGHVAHQNGTGDLFQLAGNIQVTAASTFDAKQGHINVLAPISGNGNLTIAATDDNGDTTQRIVTLMGASALTGNIDVIGKLRLGETGSMLFDIGASGVNNSVSGTGWAEFNGTFNFDLAGASATPGNSWTIANVAAQSFGSTFAVAGFSKSGDFWTNGTFLFNPLSGTLSVSAPPVAWNVDGGGNWGVGANWSGGVVPAAGSEVVFGSVLTAANAPATISLNSPESVSRITFNNANQYIIGGPSTLTLTGLAQLSSGSGAHEISAVIAGTSGLTKTGGGDIILSANNTYSGLTDVQAGALRLRAAGSVDGNASVAAGAMLAFEGDELGGGYNGAFAGDVSGAGEVLLSDTLTTETVTFTGAKSYTGQTTIVGGTLAISNAGALGAADGTVATRTLVDGNQATGKLALSGSIAVGNELLTLEAREFAAVDAPHVTSSGNNSWSGNIKGEIGGTQYNIVSSSGTLTLSGLISAPDSGARNFVFDGAGNTAITGKITDQGTNADGTLPVGPTNVNSTVSVIKRGSGTLTIGTATNLQDDYWLGSTVVEGGTLEVLSDGANNGEIKSATIEVQAGAVLDVDHFGVYALQVGQSLSGGGTVRAGGNTVAIFDDNHLTPGDDSVGTLNIEGEVSLTGGAPGGTLNYDLGNATTVGGAENDLINITGGLTTSGGPTMTLNVTPVEANLAAGNYRLISHTGGATDMSGVTPVVVGPGGAPLTIRQTLAVSGATAGQVNLVVTGNESSLVWSGAVGTAWDVSSSANWAGGNVFFDLDDVTFSDAAGANDTVDISTTAVTPGSVTFTSAMSNTYTVAGAQGIQGGGALSLTGNVTAVLANTGNNLTGPVNLASGTTLQQGSGTSTGTTLLLGDVGGAGALRVNSGILQLSGNNTYTSVTTINGGELNMDSTTALGSTAAGTVVNGGVLRSNGDAFTTSEPVTLNGGAVAVGGGAAAALTLAGPITVGAGGGTIQVDGGTGDDGLTIGGAIGGSAGAALNANVDGGSTMTVTGNIANNGALNKNGSGVLALGASTTVASPVVNVNEGTFDVSAQATYTVASGKTLSGNDGGVVVGNVSAASGSTIRVGGAGLPEQEVFSYVDATHGPSGNTMLATGGTFTPTTNPDWQQRTGFANNGQLYQGGSDDPNSAGTLKTTISGLTPGQTYTVYANYWGATGSSWRILAGASAGSLTLFDSPADAVAGAADGVDADTLIYSAQPLTEEGNRSMWGAPLGNLVANSSGQIEVFVDDTGTVDGDDRTWYDGVSYSTGATAFLSETMTLQGDLTLNAGSTLALDIATPDALDRLAVAGNLLAGGTLQVMMQAGAPSPTAGDVFDILDFTSAAGAFSSLSLPSLTAGLAWDATSLLATGELSVVTAGGLPGDFDADSDVDGADFLAWQRNMGVGSLNDWKADFGANAVTPVAGVVPEPAAWALAGMAALLVSGHIRRR